MSQTVETRLLCVGDMHLGRRPGGLPAHLSVDHGLEARHLGPAEAWDRVVQAAIARQVHAVALAGDLVHRLNALHEAYGLLETGIRRLDAAGITVCAVAGNHDYDTLPRLAGLTDRFILLGPGGTWTSHLVTGDGGARVRLTGWSFPAGHHTDSPLAQRPPAVEPGTPTVGILHADRDAGRSQYAPVSSADLAACHYAGWFLGHIHVPDTLSRLPQPIYLGSVSGLDPGETGLHGPVLVTLGADGSLDAERLPLAPLRWELLEVAVRNLDDPDRDLPTAILDAMTRLAAGLGAELESTRALGLRLVLTGVVSRPAELRRAITRLDLAKLVVPLDGTALFVQKISVRLQGAYDLADLSRQDDPVGLMARQLLALDGAASVPGIPDPTALVEDLLTAARTAIATVDDAVPFADLRDKDVPTVDDGDLKARLLRQGRRALDHLLAGAGETHASD